MRRHASTLLCLAAVASLGGCMHQPSAADPNPAPPPDYGVVCHSTPGLFAWAFNDFVTACRPVTIPAEPVLRSRG